MFLVAVVPSPVISEHGIDEFLKIFVEDLNALIVDGLSVDIGCEVRHYNIALLAFIADNLAPHQLGGFKESMSFAFRICRSCMATKNHSQIHFKESNFILRNTELHCLQCSKLEGSMRDHYSVSFGINRRSILNDIRHFSVATNMPHDVMHDLFEGVFPLELKAMLTHFCIHSRLFSIKLSISKF